MHANMNEETAKAWEGWVAFTRFVTVSVIVVFCVLGLMALTLL
jgi:hypothetical protein